MSMSPADVSNLSVWDLYRHANCGRPDSSSSPGAEFLHYVRDEVVRVWQRLDDPVELDESDEAPVIKWQEFVDLAAYNESPEMSEHWPSDLDEAATLALYQIADRLACYLFQELKEWHEEQGDDEDDDEDDSPVDAYPADDEW